MPKYSFINVPFPYFGCPKCGNWLPSWQSKDERTWPAPMKTLKWCEVQQFHNYCEHCQIWIEYRLKLKPPAERTWDDYELKIIEDK